MGEFKYSNVEREIEVYGYDSVVKSPCRGCHGGRGSTCIILARLREGTSWRAYRVQARYSFRGDAERSLLILPFSHSTPYLRCKLSGCYGFDNARWPVVS